MLQTIIRAEVSELDAKLRPHGPFQSDHEELIETIIFLAERLKRRRKTHYKKYKLNEHHIEILKILEIKFPEAIHTGKIKNALSSNQGDLTRLIDKLEKLSLVHRARNPEKKTEILTMLTPQGRQLMQQIKAKELFVDLTEMLSKKDANSINNLLSPLLSKL